MRGKWGLSGTLFVIVACGLVFAARANASENIVWSEDWEGDWTANWHVDGGTWEVGAPTSGPDSAYSGLNCAATILAGNYPEGVNSRLIRHTPFVVPPASENPRLRFWHWYSFSCSDYGKVQIKVGNGAWADLFSSYAATGSGTWSRPLLDLSGYGGQTVQVAFFFHSEDNYNCNYPNVDVSSGWYIDEVALVTGAYQFNNPEGFESGLGDWSSERGTWEVGDPSSGPGAGHNSPNCAATVLAGNYAEGVDSRLISPPFVVPSASDIPRLRFWHWYSFSCSDYGKVQIKVGNGAWADLFSSYAATGSGTWSRPLLDLSGYGGQTVQVAFFFHSEDNYNCSYPNWDVSSGWYIDEVTLVTGAYQFNNPEGFESGLGDWSSERGTWEVGDPSSGPGAGHNSPNCAATVLAGNYAEGVDSRLISPPFVVPSASDIPRLRFWHWYSFSCSDYGKVQIKVGNGAWADLFSSYAATGSGTWSRPLLDLSGYGGQTVQVAFFFHSEDNYNCSYPNWDVSSGWYIDEVALVTGAYQFNNPEGFESGLGDWSSERGTWEVGDPSSGPGTGHNSPNCAATVLAGNYADGVESRLISPIRCRIGPENASLSFWHWFCFNCGDFGEVQLRVDDEAWTAISSHFTGSSGAWTFFWVDLSQYVGRTVQVAFRFHSEDVYNCNYPNPDVCSGWYIDDVQFSGCTAEAQFVRCDVDASQEINISDCIYSLAYQFAQGAVPPCLDATDVDDSGEINISDPIYCLAYQFSGGPTPPAPFPACGSDPTPDGVSCDSFGPCSGQPGPAAKTVEGGGNDAILLDRPASTLTGEIQLPVSLSTAQPLAGFEFTVSFDSMAYEFIGLDRAGAPPLAFYSATTDASAGQVRAGAVVDLAMASSLAQGTHSIGSLRFRPRNESDQTPATSAGQRTGSTSDAAGSAAQSRVRPSAGFVLSGGRLVRQDMTAVLIGSEPAAGSSTSDVIPGSGGSPRDRLLTLSNPYHAQTPIVLELPEAGNIEITVYNVSGQAVRQLYNGSVTAGRHEMSWNGRTEDDQDAGAGVYFLRARIGKEYVRKTVILAR